MAEGRFVVFMPHDDYFCRDDFISIALAGLRANSRAKVFIANSVIEGTNRKMMAFSSGGIHHFTGEDFIVEKLWGEAHPAYSAVLIENEALKAGSYGSFFDDRLVTDRANVEPDEMFVGIVLASFDNDVLVTGEVFSIRGDPEESYSKSEFWRRRGVFGVFLVSIRLARFFMQMKRFTLAIFFTKLATGLYAPENMDWRVIRFMDYSPSVTLLMFAGVLRTRLRRLGRGFQRRVAFLRRFFSERGQLGP
jgi:hypothetical protein